MTAQIPDSHKDLLTGPVPVTIATLMPDGQPQLSVVWCDYDGEYVLVNTARDRQKDKNIEREPTATVLAIDPTNPYRYLEVRGDVELTEEGALEHINRLARLYTDNDTYYGGAAPAERAKTETRVTVKITPRK